MKKLLKRNQIMITALALMIAIAGYLNFMGKKVDEEALFTPSAQFEEAAGAENDESLAMITEDTQQTEDLSAALTDIDSMDSEEEMVYSDYLGDEPDADAPLEVAQEPIDLEQSDIISTSADPAEVAKLTEDYEGETPGEAVFTSGVAIGSIEGANLLKEQTRAQNKEALMEIINSEALSDEAKQDAVASMIELTDISQKECSAQIMLEAKGFEDVIVSLSGEQADVLVATNEELTQAQMTQIIDIVSRKTGIAAENIIISPVASK